MFENPYHNFYHVFDVTQACVPPPHSALKIDVLSLRCFGGVVVERKQQQLEMVSGLCLKHGRTNFSHIDLLGCLLQPG